MSRVLKLMPASSGLRILSLVMPLLFLLLGCGGSSPKKLQVGDAAPLFETLDMSGLSISLAALRNRPVVLRFFVPDCKYCRADTIVFNQFYADHKDKGLMVIYVNTDPNPAQVQKFVEELEIIFPVILDQEGLLAAKYQVQVVPQTITLTPGHTINGAILGGVSREELDDLLGVYLTDS